MLYRAQGPSGGRSLRSDARRQQLASNVLHSFAPVFRRNWQRKLDPVNGNSIPWSDKYFPEGRSEVKIALIFKSPDCYDTGTQNLKAGFTPVSILGRKAA